MDPPPSRACRVCLIQEGARNIFQSYPVDDERCSVASVNRLAEKLRYVLTLPVSEDDGMHSWICELCIIQLNVAFNFKRLAIESIQKLSGNAEAHLTNLLPVTKALTPGTIGPDCPEPPMVYAEPWVKLEQTTEDYCPIATAEISSSTRSPDDTVVPRIAAVQSLQKIEVREEVNSIHPSMSATVSPSTVEPAASCSVADTAEKHEAEKEVHLDQTNTAKALGMVIINYNLKDAEQDTENKRYLRSNHLRIEPPTVQHDSAPPPATKQEAKQSNICSTKPSSENVRKIPKKKSETPHASDQENDKTVKTSAPVRRKNNSVRLMDQLRMDLVNGSVSFTDDEFNLPIAKKVKLRRHSVGYPTFGGG